MKTKEQEKWDGAGWFESNAPVTGATTELINSGPVFLDFKITYLFKGEADGETKAIPLALGKQSHLFKPNVLPRETIPRLENSYVLLLRFVMDDIWIDVNERFHFPEDEKSSDFGISHYYIGWGEHMPVDTASRVRWFEYDSFGGNTDQKYVPAEPRPAQKGWPFARAGTKAAAAHRISSSPVAVSLRGKTPMQVKATSPRIRPSVWSPHTPANG